jgi:hypothetical protein
VKSPHLKIIDSLAVPILQGYGYQLINDGVYRAIWSTVEVEHFIYLHEPQRVTSYFGADFGIRNFMAEVFSCNVIHAYGGELLKLFRCAEPTSCAMRFSFARLKPPPRPMPFTESNDFILNLPGLLESHLMPIVRNVASLNGFFSILTSDVDSFSWAASNGAIRAAQIVAVAGQLGVNHMTVREILKSRMSLIAHGGSKSSLIRSNPDAYIEVILRDWDKELRRELIVPPPTELG